MAQANVPAEFYQAKSDIEHYKGTGSPVRAVLAGWTTSDRLTFARWYSVELQTRRADSIREQRAKTAMHPDSYLNHFEAVDFSNTASITGFVNDTQIRDWEPYPTPIVLGSEEGIVYYLCSQLVDLEASFDLPAGATSSDYITELRSANPNTGCPLQFVLPLGILAWSVSPDSSRCETPFRVCVNPINRSIWLVLAPYEVDYKGDRISIPWGTDPWPWLGLHSHGRVLFDVMELMPWEEFQNLGDQSMALTRSMFGLAEAAVQVWPTAWVPTKEAVNAAL
ncbi:hypothetical protein MMC07_004181 [Pseudocyphellaria aurata]|nr:hypothetical protein [Pseudocyphellaria aurata]